MGAEQGCASGVQGLVLKLRLGLGLGRGEWAGVEVLVLPSW